MIIDLDKRKVLRHGIYLLLATIVSSVSKVFASWPKSIFNEKDSNRAIAALIENDDAKESEQIFIKTPEIAENGGVVPVTISTDLKNVNKISILVENNPSPLTSSFQFNDQLSPYVSTRVKMAKTSDIIAVVNTDNGNFRAARNVKVTIGGCGG